MTQLTPEDLKDMSPEQIAELQKQNCIFCHIISGRVASKKVYEDEKCIAVLDINPANPGHVLLMPKEHYAIMPLIPEDIIGHLFMVSKGISHACLRAFKAQGTNIFVANGVAAGQKAQHFMIHVIPRKEKDGLTYFTLPKKRVTKQQLEELKKILKARINFVFGVKEEKPIELGKAAEKSKEAEERTKAKPGLEKEEIDAGVTGEEKGEKEDEEEKEGGEEREEEKESDEEEKEKDEEGINLDKIADLLGGSMGGRGGKKK